MSKFLLSFIVYHITLTNLSLFRKCFTREILLLTVISTSYEVVPFVARLAATDKTREWM